MSSLALPVHSSAFKTRRFLNWFPLGIAYAFLYMGRYNINVAKSALGSLMTKEDFGVIFGIGTLIYGFAFLVNGPLTDRIGGKRAMLIALGGAALSNLMMGLFILRATSGAATDSGDVRLTFSFLYGTNMYFQSFGAVAIVKVNAYWFHVRERGSFSGIFGTMISSGIFLAYTVNGWILSVVAGARPAQPVDAQWVFFGPAMLLGAIFFVELLLLKDRPGLAGQEDFDTGDASSGVGEDVPLRQVLYRVVSNPIILTVALIEFCTGVLRQGIMQWLPFYAEEVLGLPPTHYLRHGSWGNWPLVLAMFGVAITFFVAARFAKGKARGWLTVSGGLVALAPFVQGGWGGVLFVAGVIGGNVAGWVSDLFFQSRRAPAAGGLYLGLAVAAIGMYFALGGTTPLVGWSEPDKKAAAAKLDQLQPGDRVVEIAGKSDIKVWRDVQRAVACYPVACASTARFDAKKCSCTSANVVAAPVPDIATAGTIPARVVRAGQTIALALRDPALKVEGDKRSWTMRGGDSRKLKAGPVPTQSPIWLALIVVVMSTCVIGTHGLLSGTATMDFGGRRGAATAVGMIDGFVYLGSALEAFALGYLTSKSWSYWPLFLLPFALVGFFLLTRIWKAVPKGKGGH